jgi:hypothetical protein
VSSWLDYGADKMLADKPEPRGPQPTLASLRPEHGTVTYAKWQASLPREALVRQDDITALRLAEERERMAAEQRVGRRKR